MYSTMAFLKTICSGFTLLLHLYYILGNVFHYGCSSTAFSCKLTSKVNRNLTTLDSILMVLLLASRALSRHTLHTLKETHSDRIRPIKLFCRTQFCIFIPVPCSLASGKRCRPLFRKCSLKTRASCSSAGMSAISTPSQITDPYSAAVTHTKTNLVLKNDPTRKEAKVCGKKRSNRVA